MKTAPYSEGNRPSKPLDDCESSRRRVRFPCPTEGNERGAEKSRPGSHRNKSDSSHDESQKNRDGDLASLVRDLSLALIATAEPTPEIRALILRAERALGNPRRRRLPSPRPVQRFEPVVVGVDLGTDEHGAIAVIEDGRLVATGVLEPVPHPAPTPPHQQLTTSSPSSSSSAPTAPMPSTASPEAPVSSGRWKKPCKAVCADSGKRCALPEHPPFVAHSIGRTTFVRIAAPGQTFFPAAAEFEARATGRKEVRSDA